MGARSFKYNNTSRSQTGGVAFLPLCFTEQRIRKFHSIFIISLSQSKVLSSIKRVGGIVCAESIQSSNPEAPFHLRKDSPLLKSKVTDPTSLRRRLGKRDQLI